MKFHATADFIREYGDLYTAPQKAYRDILKHADKNTVSSLNLKSVWAKSDFTRKMSLAALELKA